jgi:Ca-activated chloride channel family protein
LLSHFLKKEQSGTQYALYLLLLIWCFMVIGLMGPSFEEQEQLVYQGLQSRMIVLDLSRSMDAKDIKPSRLTRAKYKVTDLLKQEESGQTGLIVFSGEPYVVSPLTRDTKTIAAVIPVLETELMPVPGNNIGMALDKARELLSGVQRGDVILITDSIPDAKARRAAKNLHAAGYRLDVLGVGTSKPAPIPSSSGFVSNEQGGVVLTSLSMPALNALASVGGGKAVRFTLDDSDVKQLQSWFSQSGPAEESVETISQWIDEGYWLALLVALLVLPFSRRKESVS